MYYLEIPTTPDRFLAYVNYLNENNVDINRIFQGEERLIQKYINKQECNFNYLCVMYDPWTHTNWLGIFYQPDTKDLPFPSNYVSASICSIF